ncbi:hypothetical protein PLESTM_000033000 [Pleodorina starrii]|nr:hypothetical protein PLESTM_000033000 [Pleodorina starrii]
MQSLPRGTHGHFSGRRTRPLGASGAEQEVSHGRLRSSGLRRIVQVRAAHAHRPSTDILETGAGAGPAAAVAAAAGGASVFSYLGLGSRNSDTVDDGAAAAAEGGASSGAAAAAAAAGSAGEALLCQLRRAKDLLGSSLEQFLLDGVAEGLPGWPTSQMAGVLMVLALLQRRPDDAWLNEYWSVSGARLPECTTADLAMLSYGLSELRLQPPHAWTTALLASTLLLAEAPLERPVSADAAAADAGADGATAEGPSLSTTLQLVLQKLMGSGSSSQRQPRASLWLGSGGGGGGSSYPVRSLPATLRRLLSNHGPGNGAASGLAEASGGVAARPAAGAATAPTAAWLPATDPTGASTASSPGGDASASSRVGGIDGGLAAAACQRPINSAYDMEDFLGGAGPERSSSIAELVLEPVQALWGGAAAAAAGVSAAWRRSRGGSELVTVVYNLTAVGAHVEDAWLARFLQAMRPRLAHLSGDDLHCLLVVAAEAASGSGGGSSGLVEAARSREWQAALFARMDGINWALQGRHLVGCLGCVSSLGLRPPPPWVRRQLRSLQPGLQFLPTPALVQLGGLLPLLPLHWEGAEGAPTTAAGAGSSDGSWLARWLAEYRAAVSERRATMEAADLLAVIAGVAAVTSFAAADADASALPTPFSSTGPAHSHSSAASAPAAASRDVASLLLPLAGEVPYSEWRQTMLDAAEARLSEANLAGLCEAWQVLADATSGAQLLQQQQLIRAGGDSGVETSGGAPANVPAVMGESVRQLEGLRELLASRLAVHQAQLSTTDVAPVLSSLAAAGLPLPPATLDALLTSAQPLLPGLTSSELVTVALSLVRLSYKPNLAWQAAFCAASRRRLGLMTPAQRCSLLVASASLGLHLPDPWVRDFFAVSERGLAEQLDGQQLANLLWAVSCVASEPAVSWLEQWEAASLPRLRELGPNMLAVVLKAMSTLHYRPSLAWQSVFFAALQSRLFAAGAAQLTWPTSTSTSTFLGSDSDSDAGCSTSPNSTSTMASSTSSSSSSTSSPAAASVLSAYDLESRSGSGSGSFSLGSSGSVSGSAASGFSGSGSSGMLSATVTAEALNSLVYSLASLDLSPPSAWLDELADAIRCKLSLLSTLDLSVVLAYLVARSHRPNDEWWESFLEALESRFDCLSAGEMSSLLVMLNALRVSPSAQWLDAFCAATEARLVFFGPSHLLQVLSCLHLFRHRPGQGWMAAYTGAVEGQLPRFTPTELARAMMLLDNLNQRPSAAFMLRFYDFSRAGLTQLDTQELVNVAWAVVSCSSLQPDIRWTEALVEAARPRLASLQQPQLRVLVAALGHMQRGAPCAAASDFLAFAREFLLV